MTEGNVNKTEAAIEKILMRRIIERKLVGYTGEAAAEIAKEIEALNAAPNILPDLTEQNCDGS